MNNMYIYSLFITSKIQSSAVEPPTIKSNTFDGVEKDNFTLEVPPQSVKRYQAETGWSDFKRIAAHYDFSVSRERMRALNAVQSRTYTLRAPANFAWEVESKPDWVTVSPSSGTGKADVTISVNEMSRTSDTFEVNEGSFNSPSYKNYAGRSGEVVFKLIEKDYTTTFEVEQYDCDLSDGEVKTYQTATKGNGIDIVFIGDGYDAKDIAKGTFFTNTESGYNAFFDVEPYKTYKDYFNVYAVVSQSDESGIGTVNTIIDTKFGSTFSQNRILAPDTTPCFEWAKKANSSLDLTKSLTILLMNISTYEGVTMMYGDGSAIACCPVSTDAYPYDFRGIIQHEVGGHGFGKLGDEYIYHNAFIQNCTCTDGCGHPKGENDLNSTYGIFKSHGWYKDLSLTSDATQVPWAHLIFNPKYSDFVDMFEGEIPDDIVSHIYNTNVECTVSLNTGSVEKNAFGAKKTITMNKLSNELFEAVLVPQNIEKTTPLIELTMGGIAYLLDYSLSFRAGYAHTITVTLNTSPDQEKIEISIDPGVEDWE